MSKAKFINILDNITVWALYILVFSLPFSKSIVEISIMTAIVSWILKKVVTGRLNIKETPLNIPLFAFAIICAISILNADYKLLAVRSLFSKCLKYLVLYFIVAETIDSGKKVKNILKAGLASALIVIIDSFIQYYLTHVDLIRLYPSFKAVYPPFGIAFNFLGFPITEYNFLGYPTGPFPFPNDLSAYMPIIFMPALFLFLWYYRTARSRFMLGTFLFPFLYLFYLANTRAAWLSSVISFFSTFFIMMNTKRVIVIVIGLSLILMIVLSLPFLPKSKLMDLFGLTSMQDRLYMWRIGWKIFLEHPIIGSGINSFFLKFKEFREDEDRAMRGSYAHNGYLQLAVETGAFGLSLFILLIGRAFFAIFRYIREAASSFYKNLASGLAAGLSAFLIHSFFDTNLQSLPLVTLFWFTLALSMALRDIEYAR